MVVLQDIGDATSVSLLNMDASEHTLEVIRDRSDFLPSLCNVEIGNDNFMAGSEWKWNAKTQFAGDPTGNGSPLGV